MNTSPATENQLRYVHDLITSRDLSSIVAPKYVARIAELSRTIPAYLSGIGEVENPMTWPGASTLIEGLKDLPKSVDTIKAEANRDSVPAGHYAIVLNDEVEFFRVDKPTEGKWAGYTFVKRLVGPEEHRLSRDTSASVIAEITLDPKAAAVRYGHEIGRCCICNRRLTNAASRSAGIGPVCAEMF